MIFSLGKQFKTIDIDASQESRRFQQFPITIKCKNLLEVRLNNFIYQEELQEIIDKNPHLVEVEIFNIHPINGEADSES